jgi:hypothetical protein
MGRFRKVHWLILLCALPTAQVFAQQVDPAPTGVEETEISVQGDTAIVRPGKDAPVETTWPSPNVQSHDFDPAVVDKPNPDTTTIIHSDQETSDDSSADEPPAD